MSVFVGMVALIVVFALAIPHANRDREMGPTVASTTPVINVVFRDTYKGGVHTIRGTVLAPTPCTSVDATATVARDTPPVIAVDIAMPQDTGVCLQIEESKDFSVSVTAALDAMIEFYVNGERATTTEYQS